MTGGIMAMIYGFGSSSVAQTRAPPRRRSVQIVLDVWAWRDNTWRSVNFFNPSPSHSASALGSHLCGEGNV